MLMRLGREKGMVLAASDPDGQAPGIFLLAPDAGAQPGLVLIDIQGLRDANHTYGHTAGDDLLQEVAKRLRGTLRNYDCVARWDAKRFALLVPQVPDDGALWRVAESLRQVITSAPIPIGDGHEIWTRCAVGCAHGSTDLTDADLLLDAASK